MTTVDVVIPLQTFSSNEQRRWVPMKRHRIVKEQRAAVALMLATRALPPPPVRVTMTRVAPPSATGWRPLDGDNLEGALKSVRDAIAKSLGIDDKKGGGAEWHCDQQPGAKGQHEVRVRIEAGGGE